VVAQCNQIGKRRDNQPPPEFMVMGALPAFVPLLLGHACESVILFGAYLG